jgi:NitT/TauT family transport system ATP-binding protein
VDRLKLQFSGEPLPLLDVHSLELQANQPTVLMAPSGWGKTVLFRSLSGWYKAGTDPALELSANYSPTGDVEFIGNHLSLLPWLTIEANAALRATGGSIKERLDAFQAVGLTEDIRHKWPYELSLGMYKRAELVCALLRHPKILILDEFFASLDDESRTKCAKVLAPFSRERVLLMSTHHLEVIPFDQYRLLKLARKPGATTVTVVS